ncbi:MAG: helix-turn-helix transcriptional regulator [Oscillospiraceae bacterium]|nr:helix-turn-helix transcriptional regulator [Oscillospiraceae bacterium]
MHQNEFGSLLRELRENACMTARELAYMFEIEEQEIMRWETGESKPPVELVYQLADIYDLPPRELIKLRNADERPSIMPAAILAFSLLCALAGFFLYHAQLGGRNALTVVILSVLVCAVFALLAVRYDKKELYEQVFKPFVPESICSFAGAVMMAASGVLTLFGGKGMQMALGVGMILAGACFVKAAFDRMQGKRPSVLLYVLPLLLFVAKLFFDFRRWMVDPQIMDYGFMLFASITLMLMTYHAAEFCFDKGKRRVLMICSLAAVYFGGVSLATSALAQALFYGGGILWAFACAMQTLRADEV